MDQERNGLATGMLFARFLSRHVLNYRLILQNPCATF
jgi:hypothetical protein